MTLSSLSGKRTIASVVVAIVTALMAMWTGDKDLKEVLTLIKEVAALAAMGFLRKGVSNETQKLLAPKAKVVEE